MTRHHAPSQSTGDDAFGGCPLGELPEDCCGDRLDCASREQLKTEVARLRNQRAAADERIEQAARLLDGVADDARRAMDAEVDMRAGYVEGKAVFIRQILEPGDRS